MYEKFYGFSIKPFGISPDPKFLYLNASYREALALLQYGLMERKGIVCIIGEVGTGKTMLLNKLLQTNGKDITPVIVMPYPGIQFGDLLHNICQRLQLPSDSIGVPRMLDGLLAHLSSEYEQGRTVALLVDEAQTMDVQALETLRLLSNLETPQHKLLQIVLLGQPELKEKLALRELRQFKQRITHNFELKSLSEEEIPNYIACRLKTAGSFQGLKVFTDQALHLICSYSRGIPRLINTLCDNAFLIGYVLKKPQIDSPVIEEAARDILLEAPAKETEPSRREPIALPVKEPLQKAPRPRSLMKWWAATALCGLTAAAIGSYSLTASRHAARAIGNSMWNSVSSLAEKPSIVKKKLEIPESVQAKAQESGAQLSIKTDEPPATVHSLEDAEESSSPERAKADNEISAPPSVIQKRSSSVAVQPDISPRRTNDYSPHTMEVSQSSHEEISVPEVDQKVPVAVVTDQLEMRPTQPSSSSRAPGTVQIRTVRQGDTLLSIAQEAYGNTTLEILSFMQFMNPQIDDLDRIKKDQKLILPDLSARSRITQQADHKYTVFLTATPSSAIAMQIKQDMANRGVSANIIPIDIRGKTACYRLQAEGMDSRETAEKLLESLSAKDILVRVTEENHESNL